MKKLLLLIVLFAFFQLGYGQCDKKVIFKCSKARELKNGAIGQDITMDATITLEKGKAVLSATVNGESETAEGEIREVSICEWTEYLKNGKTQYRASMNKGNGTFVSTIISIESDNGNTKITFGSDPDTGSQLQFDVAEYTLQLEERPNLHTNVPVKKKGKKKSKNSLSE